MGKPVHDHLSDMALPTGIRSRFVENGNGLNMHILESGYDGTGKPGVVLLHGFPELAYSWRKLMLPLADAGYHVIAPDQRGYGQTTGWDANYHGDLTAFRFVNLVTDILGLIAGLGIKEVHGVIGHDFGSPVAAYCALIRPDVFRSVVMMSAPFAGSESVLFGAGSPGRTDIHEDLGRLARPRKHYQWYYSKPEANANMVNARQGLHAFLRAYYHFKSADWTENLPHKLAGWTADDLAQLPTYYIMDRDLGMAETVAPQMPDAQQISVNQWLPDRELAIYSQAYAETGFQGGLQWYRCVTSGLNAADLKVFSGCQIHQPALFLAGRSDWGVYQKPGDFENMQQRACLDLRGCQLIDGAGHWVQQEQPQRVLTYLLPFLNR